MSDDEKNEPHLPHSDDAADAEGGAPDDRNNYPVGYGRPPEHGKIKPGEVRNRRGKPKGTKSFKKDVQDVFDMPVPYKDHTGKWRHITTRKANLLKLREKALKDDQRSIEKIIELNLQYAEADEAHATTAALSAEDEAILKHARERDLDRANAVSVTPKAPAGDADEEEPEA